MKEFITHKCWNEEEILREQNFVVKYKIRRVTVDSYCVIGITKRTGYSTSLTYKLICASRRSYYGKNIVVVFANLFQSFAHFSYNLSETLKTWNIS